MKTISGKPLSKIGIGSYGIGGRGHRDMPLTDKKDDSVYIETLAHMISSGLNFTELSMGYGHGNSVSLFKWALEKSGVAREDLFLTNSLYPRDLPNVKTINDDISSFYSVLETNYADSTLVTQSLLIKFGEETIYDILTNLLEDGKTRYVSLSNAKSEYIIKFKEHFKDKFFAHEGHLSFEVRLLEDSGVFQTCRKLAVENIIWRPLRRNQTSNHNWKLLNDLALKYDKTPNQIILNWMCYDGFRPIVMSSNKAHIDENLESLNFTMVAKDYKLIRDFRAQKPSGSFNLEENSIVELVNNFEKYN